MRAETQYELTAIDMQTVLALVRAGTLAEAARRMNLDASTVFRTVQRIERGLGQRLFDRSKRGYRPTSLGSRLAQHGERIEAELGAARIAAGPDTAALAGTVHVTTTDSVLSGLLLNALGELAARHPALRFDLDTSNGLASLTRRDADIAVRATKRAPEHLIGRAVGPLRIAVFASASSPLRAGDFDALARCDWAAPDIALSNHPSVDWRRRRYPDVEPRYRANSVVSVCELVASGLAIGVLPIFLANAYPGIRQISPPLDDAESQLWVLAHPDARHLPHVSAVYSHLCAALARALADDGGLA
ncbi:LysR family transcriptional regulator [Burkholderia thailandensis]|uniref:LysR family transcriptional regulator n=1 Tax=Burkholderia thailandensis TaxID=57975 RepID=UPI0022ABF239|nr:LysR family transcriptional regulator [Burkholderia thailandensis]MCZ2898764.1 LysR family transcriptional regulator [Burkholderia thailandensis]MDD1484509.1 LysR family transcriptional regulator [Burkholderia thailandensis]MDD1485496.1 LysR family transcriptional regulator [Burkholderia thailandensis]MDD1491339.1 LysR family transcriptional regulator [Burkholderia thailandensis]